MHTQMTILKRETSMDSKLRPFFATDNLADNRVVEMCPWDFIVDESTLANVRHKPKLERRRWMCQITTEWNVYTPVRARAMNFRVASGNPPFGLRGIVTDYDCRLKLETTLASIDQMPDNLKPNFLEVS
jgi:hypothetical protein